MNTATTPQNHGLRLLYGLARERARVQISGAQCERQLALVSPRPLDTDGFELLTLLPPSPTARLPKPGQTLRLHSWLHGAALSMEARLQAIHASAEEWLLRFDLPHEVSEVQRRQAVRLLLPADHPARRAELHAPDGVRTAAEVVDLSVLGVGLKTPLPPDTDPRQPLDCHLGGGERPLRARIAVAYQGLRQGRPHLGGRFLDPDAGTRQQLQQWVNQLERDRLRRRQSDR